MTLEDVFVRKLETDPAYILELSREILTRDADPSTFSFGVVQRHVLEWIEKSDENEELGRRILGPDLMNILRPV